MADDLFHRGARMIERVRVGHLVHPMVYTPKGGAAFAVMGTTDSTAVDTLDESGVGDVRRRRDFLIAAAALTVDSALYRPRVGDVISETIDGETVEYEVTVREDGTCWSYDDQVNKRLRIHTRRLTP